MTQRSEVRAEDATTAIRNALAALVECDPDEVTVDAPGLDDVDGELVVTFEIVSETSDDGSDSDEADEDTLEPVDDEKPQAASDDAEGSHDDSDDDSDDDRDRGQDEDDRRSSGGGISQEELDEEADAAADFVEGLLDRMDLPGDLRIRVLDDHAEVEVVDIDGGALIGRRGQTLEAVQELARCALQREFQRRSRVKIDVEGYRARRLEKLKDKALDAIREVQRTGDAQRLEPMDVFERKTIHHLVADHQGVSSHSQGREPGRRIVIEPEDD